MAAGAAVGWLFPGEAASLTVITNIFLRLIRSVIAPVLFGVLVGAAQAAAPRDLARLAAKSVVYFEVVTAIALVMGWFAVEWSAPGFQVRLPAPASGPAAAVIPDAAQLVTNAFPASIADAMARGDILQIVLFTSLFAAAVSAAGARASAVVGFAEGLTAVAFQYTRYVMLLAPFAVFSSMATTVAGNGSIALAGLAKFVAAAWAAQALFAATVFPLSLWFARVPAGVFLRAVREPFLVAFATTSSAAALPQTIEAVDRLGVSKRVAGVVTPLSLTLNMTGSSIHLAMGALFAAQAGGITLNFGQQLAILATLKLTSKGVAGIPRANLVILSGLFTQFGLPAEALPVLLGVDALIDPIRTSVNVVGHAVAAPVMARWEGEAVKV